MRPSHLYVHVPFCARRCSYCDFSIAVRPRVPVDRFVAGVERELETRFPADAPWPLDTLYFGGGTPSRLGAAGVGHLISAIRRRCTLSPGAEVTLEANPDDVSDAAVEAWMASGVTRVSLGVQSFSDPALAWMHRPHDAARALDACSTLQRAGLDNFSIDLIFALPPEVPRSWRDDLARAVEVGPAHLSLYGLTVEPATPLARWRVQGRVSDAPEEVYEDEFLAAHEQMTGAGYEHYEVSNFAKPDRRSRHNSAYWSGALYAGVGPAAHEFDGQQRRWNVAPYVDWLARVEAGQDPCEGAEMLTAENRSAEEVYLGLRTSGGLALSNAEGVRAEPWVAAGWAARERDRLQLTPTGWLRLDALAADLTDFRSRSHI